MKIVLVNNYWYLRGGAERVSLATKALLENAGHEVEIFGMDNEKNIVSNKYFADESDFQKMKGFGKIVGAWRAVYNGQAKSRFAKLVDEFKPDVIHFHNICHHLSFSILEVAKSRGIRMVMTLHDYKLICPNYNIFSHGKIDESCVGGNYYRCLLNNCMDNLGYSVVATIEVYFRLMKKYRDYVDLYISPSNFLKNKFVANGFDEKQIVVLPNPISENEFRLSSGDGEYVAFVGRVSKEKGLRYLLGAAEILPQIKFKIIGEGPERKELEKIVVDKKINNVEFLGQKHGDELAGLVDDARLLVLPSVWYENTPMSVLEAKAHGKVVVASDIGGLPEMLPAELLVESGNAQALADKIKEWYSADSETRQAMGQKLQAEVKKKNSEKVYLKKLLEIYKSM